MFKNLIKRIKYVFEREKLLKSLQVNIVALEEENTSLKNTVVESMDLVTNYKNSMMQMREYMNYIIQIGQSQTENENGNEEEEDLFEKYALLRKKTTVH